MPLWYEEKYYLYPYGKWLLDVLHEMLRQEIQVVDVEFPRENENRNVPHPFIHVKDKLVFAIFDNSLVQVDLFDITLVQVHEFLEFVLVQKCLDVPAYRST